MTNYIKHNENFLPLTFRSEALSEEACSVFLQVLATVVMQHGMKSVVCVAQCVAALIPVCRMPSLLPDVYRFLDPSGTSVSPV